MSSNQPDQLFWATRWTLRDVVALVVTAIVLGVVFYLWGWAVQLLSRILGDVVAGLFYGVWFWAGLILAYAIRKSGAALLGVGLVLTGAFALVFPPFALKWSWLIASCLWPVVWIEWTRISIRRKLPVSQWPKQLYL